MKTKQPDTIRRNSRIKLLTVAAALLAAPVAIRADIAYVLVGGTHIEQFDLATGADLGLFGRGSYGDAHGMAFDNLGNLYVADRDRNNVIKILPNGLPVAAYTTDIRQGCWAVACDKMGNLYVANGGTPTIQKFTPGGVGSLFANTSFYPSGLAFDAAGNLYASSFAENTITRFTADGVGSIFANTGLSTPWGLGFDNAGNLYVVNHDGGTVEKFTPDGVGSVFVSTDYGSTAIVIIPEPSTWALLSLGITIVLRRRTA
jgi:sugar lactone lactonase YvrE